MIDVKEIRAQPEQLRKIIRLRKVDIAKANLDRWMELDGQRRQLQSLLEKLNIQKKEIATLGKTNPDAARSRGKALRQKSQELEQKISHVTQAWQSILDWFPNWHHPDMPEGEGEDDNVEECAWSPGDGYLDASQLGKGAHAAPLMPQRPCHADGTDFVPLHHAELGKRLGGIDVVQGGKVSGSRFAYLLGDIALLQIALQQLVMEKLLIEGYQPMIPPLLVRERSLYGTSHFPEGRDQVYAIERHNVEEGNQLFLVGSSEPSNFSYFMDRTLDETELPIRIFALTPCFRSEAGSWGKDVKGIKRVHQFDKIEMNVVCTPEQSMDIYEEFRGINEWLLQTLELPYHILDKCTGDAGYLATYRQRDIEVWLSGVQEFMEVMTNTNTSDYQARRLNIRCKPVKGKSRFCHTVNDTCCAMGRMLIALIDNYQQKDASMKVPKALQPIMQKDYIQPKA